jgi:hypothetical protein
MSTRAWLDSLTEEQRASLIRVAGVSFQICMALLKEDGFCIGVKPRYSFATNMVK